MSLHFSGVGSHARLFEALAAMLSRNALNPADVSILYKHYAEEESPPPAHYLHVPQLLGKFFNLVPIVMHVLTLYQIIALVPIHVVMHYFDPLPNYGLLYCTAILGRFCPRLSSCITNQHWNYWVGFSLIRSLM